MISMWLPWYQYYLGLISHSKIEVNDTIVVELISMFLGKIIISYWT